LIRVDRSDIHKGSPENAWDDVILCAEPNETFRRQTIVLEV
jgi:hypothetical protein